MSSLPTQVVWKLQHVYVADLTLHSCSVKALDTGGGEKAFQHNEKHWNGEHVGCVYMCYCLEKVLGLNVGNYGYRLTRTPWPWNDCEEHIGKRLVVESTQQVKVCIRFIPKVYVVSGIPESESNTCVSGNIRDLCKGLLFNIKVNL